MKASSRHIIATRRLTYTTKGDSTLKDLTVCISEPYLLTEGMVDIPFAEGAAGCVLSFDGLPEREHSVIGADTFQALELAMGSVESHLRRLSKKYDFYFDGDPYFEG